MELQRRVTDLERQGLGLAVITYDPVTTLKRFAGERGLTFPLLSDQGSAVIRRYGLLNTTVAPDSRAFGIPHPGTFMLDTKGVVTARYFEAAYQERNTVESILVREGRSVGSGPARRRHGAPGGHAAVATASSRRAAARRWCWR